MLWFWYKLLRYRFTKQNNTRCQVPHNFITNNFFIYYTLNRMLWQIRLLQYNNKRCSSLWKNFVFVAYLNFQTQLASLVKRDCPPKTITFSPCDENCYFRDGSFFSVISRHHLLVVEVVDLFSRADYETLLWSRTGRFI